MLPIFLLLRHLFLDPFISPPLAAPLLHLKMSEEEKTVCSDPSCICEPETHPSPQSTPSKPSAPTPNSPRAESPTTARPLDFDDEPQDSNPASGNAAPAQQTDSETPPAAPPKPPRPLSPREQSENTLKEAFPSIDAAVIKAILNASNWNVERAFNALLGTGTSDRPKIIAKH